MSRLLALAGAIFGGSIGWWIGMHNGVMTAFMISMIGTGIGIYLGRRFAQNLE